MLKLSIIPTITTRPIISLMDVRESKVDQRIFHTPSPLRYVQWNRLHTIVSSVLLVMLLLGRADISSAQWKAPSPIDSSITEDQLGPLLAVDKHGDITVACHQLPFSLVFYRSTDQGKTFVRQGTLVPSWPEYILYDPYAIVVDSLDQLWLLWAWDMLDDGLTLQRNIVLSRSTDGGASFTVVATYERGFVLTVARLLADGNNNIHILRDSTLWIPGGPYFGLAYTRLDHGDPHLQRTTMLPLPRSPFAADQNADFCTGGDSAIFCVLETFASTDSGSETEIMFSSSVDSGITFSDFRALGTTTQPIRPRIIANTQNQLIVNFEHDGIRYLLSDDGGRTFGPYSSLGPRQPGFYGRIISHQTYSYLIYFFWPPEEGAMYYEYSDIALPPTDSMLFTGFGKGDFAVGPGGQKYFVLREIWGAESSPYMYFSSKDIIDDVVEKDVRMPDKLSLIAFPNPFNSHSTISIRGMSATREASLEIYDVVGRKVRTFDFSPSPGPDVDVVVDGSMLASGMYFVNLKTAEERRFVRILLVR
jgi:hypothetical protein